MQPGGRTPSSVSWQAIKCALHAIRTGTEDALRHLEAMYFYACLQILRKRQADEQNQRRRSLRAKGGRRVSFAPDDELETMHLFRTVS